MVKFADEWDEFYKMCLDDREELEVDDLRMTFYAGAYSLFAMLARTRDGLEAEKEQAEAVDGVLAEIYRWLDDELARRSVAHYWRLHAN